MHEHVIAAAGAEAWSALSEKLLRGEVKSKSQVVIGLSGGKLTFESRPKEEVKSLPSG